MTRKRADGAAALMPRPTASANPSRTSGEGADLIGDEVFKLARRDARHAPSPEVLEIGETGMRTNGHALEPGQLRGSAHDLRVACVEAAGDIGCRDDVEHGGIVTHGPGAEAFADIRVEIDFHLYVSSGERSTVTMRFP
jgi:hypothetical protein